MTVYYNEFDKYAARWLRNLIAAGHIAPGDVDDRSIEDVRPGDLRGYTQCHFFAGVGVWSYALRQAGWSDTRRVWTGSCPCQPFSSAGKGAGFADERHLWPHWYHLITQCRPPNIFGEQVASKDADPWIDLVQTDMEALGYAFAAVPFPAASVGAPHARERTYWVANSNSPRLEVGGEQPSRQELAAPQRSSAAGGVADDDNGRLQGAGVPTEQADRCGEPVPARGCEAREHNGAGTGRSGGAAQTAFDAFGGATNGLWRDADWLSCRDGKWRPVEPGSFPLAHGAVARVGRVRAYGNAIVAPQAQVWIETVMECMP